MFHIFRGDLEQLRVSNVPKQFPCNFKAVSEQLQGSFDAIFNATSLVSEQSPSSFGVNFQQFPINFGAVTDLFLMQLWGFRALSEHLRNEMWRLIRISFHFIKEIHF